MVTVVVEEDGVDPIATLIKLDNKEVWPNKTINYEEIYKDKEDSIKYVSNPQMSEEETQKGIKIPSIVGPAIEEQPTFVNNPMIHRPQPPQPPQPSKSNKTFRNMGDSMKGTESSNAKITPRFSTVTQQKSLGGRKRTRKNKKKTKTMRRKRRNL